MAVVLSVLKTTLKKGKATHPYPRRSFDVDEYYRGRPVIKPEVCMGCGACVMACPAETISIVNDTINGIKTWEISYARCIFCARCHEVCPIDAIKLTREFELASKRKDDLKMVVKMKLARCESCKHYMMYSERQIMFVQKVLKKSLELAGAAEELSKYTMMCPTCKRNYIIRKIVAAIGGGVK